MATKAKDTKKVEATKKKTVAAKEVVEKKAAETKAYTVRLSNAGNPDHNQDPTKPLPCIKNKTVPVVSVEAAKKACLDYIEGNNLGAGNWTGGEITDVASGKRVANVAYNGKALYDVEAEVIDPKPAKKKTVHEAVHQALADKKKTVAKNTSKKVEVAASMRVTVASIVGELIQVDPKVNYDVALAAVLARFPTASSPSLVSVGTRTRRGRKVPCEIRTRHHSRDTCCARPLGRGGRQPD